MRYRWLIIDGNNLIHSDPLLASRAGRDFETARDALVHQLEPLVGELAERVTVVFDGRYVGAAAYASSAVEVCFSPAHLTADSVIERLVGRAADRERIVVVSSDRPERDTVEASGVHTVSCRSFREWRAEEEQALQKRIDGTRNAGAPPTLGEHFPPSSS